MMKTIESLLSCLNIVHSRSYLNKLVSTTPYSNSMLGMKSILSHYGIKMTGLYFENKEDAAITVPCILHLKNEFVVCKDIIDDNILLIRNGHEEKQNLKNFCTQWTGNALFAEVVAGAKEPDLRQHIIDDVINCLSAVFVISFPCIFPLFMIACQHVIINPSEIPLLVLDIFGYLLCLLLIQKQVVGSSIVGDKVCSLFHQKDCNNVLSSDASKIIGTYTWSEIGLSYFSTRLILPILLGYYPTCLWIVCFLAMAYGPWSIWYQLKVVKQWCILCLFVQIVVWGQGLYHLYKLANFSLTPLLVFCTLYTVILFLTHIVSFSFIKEKELSDYKLRLRTINTNEEVFRTLLHSCMFFPDILNASHIYFGNMNGNIIITVFTNPHCNPCALIHKKLDRLIKANPQIKVQYIFSAFNEELEKSNRYLIAAYQQSSLDEAEKIYRDWYCAGKLYPEAFFLKHPKNLSNENVEKEHFLHKRMDEKLKFSITPTILVNGYQLPTENDIEDLEFISQI